MADPRNIPAAAQRAYTLDVPIHDLVGDVPPVEAGSGSVTVTLVRLDGDAGAPVFGPRGLIDGELVGQPVRSQPRQGDADIQAETIQFRLLPNAYFFVPTRYVLALAGRVYLFTMPAADSGIVALLDAEDAAPDDGGDDGGGVTARRLPEVETAADLAALEAAENARASDVLFALVTADFGHWRHGDVLVWTGAWTLLVRTESTARRTRGRVLAWFAFHRIDPAIPGAGPDVAEAPVRGDLTTLRLVASPSTDRMRLHVAYSEALDADGPAILSGGQNWSGAGGPLAKETNTQVRSGQGTFKIWVSVADVDLSQGAALDLELALQGPRT